MKRSGLKVVIALGALFTCEAQDADARVRFKNGTDFVVSAALAMQDNDDGGWGDSCNTGCDPRWENFGWYVMNPGETKTAATNGAEDFNYRFFAQSSGGHVWDDPTDAVRLATPNEAFDLCGNAPGAPLFNRQSYRRFPFPIYLGGCGDPYHENFTLTLTL